MTTPKKITIPGPGLPSLKFSVDANMPKGNAPIPKDI
jgi:hypothetical protein